MAVNHSTPDDFAVRMIILLRCDDTPIHGLEELEAELTSQPVVSTNKACEFELDTTKPVWTQFLDVFQSEEFVSELESQALDLVQRIGRTRMEWEVEQWL